MKSSHGEEGQGLVVQGLYHDLGGFGNNTLRPIGSCNLDGPRRIQPGVGEISPKAAYRFIEVLRRCVRVFEGDHHTPDIWIHAGSVLTPLHLA